MAKTIALWASPRSGSTALMYSFGQRRDTRIMDEPLFGHFLKHTEVARPSRDEVMGCMPTSQKGALATLSPVQSDEVLFLKHMANHIEGWSWCDLDGSKHRHVILTRHPDGVLPSYLAHMASPTMLDLGYAHQRRILELAGSSAVVITAESLFADPKAVLTKLCEALELPWFDGMLTWPAGGRSEDGVWAKYWYAGVHNSTGWEPRTLHHGNTPLHLQELRDQCLEHYLALEEHAL